jgi:glycerophosphoryl diester phosphodiesterase
VPRLDETLARYGGSTHLAIEIKQPGVEGDVLELVRVQGLVERVTFASFDWETACRIKIACSEVKVRYLARDVDPGTVGRILKAHLDRFCPSASALSADLVAGYKVLGLEVRAWGVRDVDPMGRAIEAGVDGMTVDFPHLLLEALGREH